MRKSDNADTGNQSEGKDSAFLHSEQYRRECEARTVLRWPIAKRRDYLTQVETHRGVDGRRYLEEEIRRQWELGRQTAPT